MSDLLLYTFAQLLDDVEGLRKSGANRIRILTGTEPDADGVVRGFGLTTGNRSVQILSYLQEDLDSFEKDIVKELQKIMKDHPLGPWVKAQKGVGEKQAARLLAAIGDPYWVDAAEFEDEDGNVTVRTAHARTVSQLWAYAGLHVDNSTGAAIRRKKGVQSNWKTEIKTRAYLVAEACVKAGVRKDSDDETGEKRVGITPYGELYLSRRARTLETHPDWTAGHSHNDALRIISKAVLKDMWIESKRIHDEKETE